MRSLGLRLVVKILMLVGMSVSYVLAVGIVVLGIMVRSMCGVGSAVVVLDLSDVILVTALVLWLLLLDTNLSVVEWVRPLSWSRHPLRLVRLMPWSFMPGSTRVMVLVTVLSLIVEL